jgi:hypothetical protein
VGIIVGCEGMAWKIIGGNQQVETRGDIRKDVGIFVVASMMW